MDESPDPLLTATLADAERYVYDAECTKCKRVVRIDLVALRKVLGQNYPLRDLRKVLRCDKCCERYPVITLLPVGSSLLIR